MNEQAVPVIDRAATQPTSDRPAKRRTHWQRFLPGFELLSELMMVARDRRRLRRTTLTPLARDPSVNGRATMSLMNYAGPSGAFTFEADRSEIDFDPEAPFLRTNAVATNHGSSPANHQP